MKRIIPVAALAIIMLISTACVFSSPQTEETVIVVTDTQPVEPTLSTATDTPLPATETPPPSSTPEQPSPTIGPVSYGPESYPAGIDPLTGMSASDPALLNRRPLSVKVQLFPRGQRPVMGVSLADIVFDYYQNSGMTRFHAIFYANNAERVGPIRSARLFDKHLVRMYKSILAFGGADGRVLRVFLNAEFYDRLVMEGSHNCPPMCRTDPNGYNFLVTDTAQLTQYATDKGIENGVQDLNGMFFEGTPPAGGQPAQQAFVRFSISAYTRWDYDAASGRYLRSQDTQETTTAENEAYAPMLDGLTNQQIAADNVVVLYVAHSYAFQTHPGNAEIIDILFNGSALGYALRDGQIYEVRWNRPKEGSVLYLTYPDGRPFPFKPGATWFEVIGQSSKMTSPAAGVWRFTFGIP